MVRCRSLYFLSQISGEYFEENLDILLKYSLPGSPRLLSAIPIVVHSLYSSSGICFSSH